MKDWEDLILETAERFGGTFPHPDTRDAVATVHARAPNAVERAIDEVAADYARGDINSPWGILRSRVQKITADVHPKATASNQRSKAIARAEQWLKNAGRHMPWTEVEAELFGDTEYTPPAEWLLELERETRDHPGRPIYNSLLEASIVRTMAEGVQEVPESGGRLREHDTPHIRQHLHEQWQELQDPA